MIPYTKLLSITPAMAKEWLARSEGTNRHLRLSHVTQLAEEMREGHWVITNQTIGISTDGIVIDGQHRLEAILKSGITIQSFVTFGLDQEAKSAIDRGVRRTLTDLTDVPQRIVQVYALLLQLYTSGAHAASPFHIRALHQELGVASLTVEAAMDRRQKFFCSASIRAAILVSILSGQDKDRVLKIANRLANSQHENLPKVVYALIHRSSDPRLGAFASRRFGASSLRVVIYVLGMYAFDESNAAKSRIIVSDNLRDHYVQQASELTARALAPTIPVFRGGIVDESETVRLRTENLRLREQMVELQRIVAQRD